MSGPATDCVSAHAAGNTTTDCAEEATLSVGTYLLLLKVLLVILGCVSGSGKILGPGIV